MIEDRIAKIEQAMIKEMERAKSNGWNIVGDITVDSLAKECCALGASVANHPFIVKSAFSIAASEYRMNTDETFSFIRGFHTPDVRNVTGFFCNKNNPFYALGVRLADKYLPHDVFGTDK